MQLRLAIANLVLGNSLCIQYIFHFGKQKTSSTEINIQP